MAAPESIYCDSTHKLLARQDRDGIWLWCKECKREHHFLWEDIGISLSVSQQLEKNTMVGIPVQRKETEHVTS